MSILTNTGPAPAGFMISATRKPFTLVACPPAPSSRILFLGTAEPIDLVKIDFCLDGQCAFKHCQIGITRRVGLEDVETDGIGLNDDDLPRQSRGPEGRGADPAADIDVSGRGIDIRLEDFEGRRFPGAGLELVIELPVTRQIGKGDRPSEIGDVDRIDMPGLFGHAFCLLQSGTWAKPSVFHGGED